MAKGQISRHLMARFLFSESMSRFLKILDSLPPKFFFLLILISEERSDVQKIFLDCLEILAQTAKNWLGILSRKPCLNYLCLLKL